MIKKATKKPITIRFCEWTGENLEELKLFTKNGVSLDLGTGADNVHRLLLIETPEGNMLASVGDKIIEGIAGEFYPCESDIFDKTYTVDMVSDIDFIESLDPTGD